MKRRDLLKKSAVIGASLALAPTCKAAKENKILTTKPFSFCFNTSTIRGQKLGLIRDLEIASEAGYDGVEVWVGAVQDFVKEGGALKDLKSMIDDLGLQVEDAIGFAQWIVDDEKVRSEALEQLKSEMDMLAQISCRRIAAPPAGATNEPGLNLDAAAERYAAILDIGMETGVMPQLEVWGFAQNLYKISQVLYVAAQSGHPGARILPDVYHLFKGGSDFDALKLIKGSAIEIFHMNDYPATPAREEMKDSDRVYPGDGVGPINEVLSDLYRPGETTVLSLELFNPTYWQQDALEVAKTGLVKMKAAVSEAGF